MPILVTVETFSFGLGNLGALLVLLFHSLALRLFNTFLLHLFRFRRFSNICLSTRFRPVHHHGLINRELIQQLGESKRQLVHNIVAFKLEETLRKSLHDHCHLAMLVNTSAMSLSRIEIGHHLKTCSRTNVPSFILAVIAETVAS